MPPIISAKNTVTESSAMTAPIVAPVISWYSGLFANMVRAVIIAYTTRIAMPYCQKLPRRPRGRVMR